jgi:hypothetical protein
MVKLCVLPSTRPALLRLFLEGLCEASQLREWNVVLALQEMTHEEEVEFASHPRVVGCWGNLKKQPIYPLRRRMEARWPADVYCAVDDDMIPLLDLTRWDEMAEMLMADRTLGTVSGNWSRSFSEGMLARVLPLKNEVIYQPLTNTAGGQLMRADVAALLRRNPYCPVKPYRHDDVQVALTAYVNGYRNARWRGSVCIHAICSAGGLHGALNEVECCGPDTTLLAARACKPFYKIDSNNLYMPVSKDVTKKARALHTLNRNKRDASAAR